MCRTAMHRIAVHRIAVHRTALHRVALLSAQSPGGRSPPHDGPCRGLSGCSEYLPCGSERARRSKPIVVCGVGGRPGGCRLLTPQGTNSCSSTRRVEIYEDEGADLTTWWPSRRDGPGDDYDSPPGGRRRRDGPGGGRRDRRDDSTWRLALGSARSLQERRFCF